MSDTSANIVELFSSIQGEGLFVGFRQIFLRFSECNLSCTYCDTDSSETPLYANIEGTAGRRDFSQVVNPVSLERIVGLLNRWERGLPGIHHSLSLTGGEPLLQHDILLTWLPELKKHLPIYLETNGVLNSALFSLIEHLDYIAMDIKLPSTSGCTQLWDDHRAFLATAAQKNVFVKAVIGAETEAWEIIKACEIICNVDVAIPLVLQPVTRKNGAIGIAPLKVLEFQEIASRYLGEVRVIPQTHKFIGQL